MWFTTQNWKPPKKKKKNMIVSIQVIMWKKCFFFDFALVGKRRYMEQGMSRIWNNVKFMKHFSIITCASLNLPYGRERERQLHDEGGRGRGRCLLSLLLSYSSFLPPSLSDTFNQWLSSEVVLFPLPQWSIGNVSGRNPNCKNIH
jgi:hypothetical protein